MNFRQIQRLFGWMVVLHFAFIANAQEFHPAPNDTLRSICILPDGKVRFSIYAPNAESIKLNSTDIPNIVFGTALEKHPNGVWEVVIGPIAPGAYRYLFSVDGLDMVDPRNPNVSESNMNVWSLLVVPGDYSEIRNVPHGAVAEVTYFSTALQCFRRMHVYTPPGYELNSKVYPVFYLLHGAYDCDDVWTTEGRAGFIMDNLIAENQAKPMVIVMPDGHVGPYYAGMQIDTTREAPAKLFAEDFMTDILPYIEQNYRVGHTQDLRAIAGLSMGGDQTLDIAISHLDMFAYIGIFSSGVFALRADNNPFGIWKQRWENENRESLQNPQLKKGLKLIWFATGEEDFLLEDSQITVDKLKENGFDVSFTVTAGGHTWTNWRDYLVEFLPLLFQ